MLYINIYLCFLLLQNKIRFVTMNKFHHKFLIPSTMNKKLEYQDADRNLQFCHGLFGIKTKIFAI